MKIDFLYVIPDLAIITPEVFQDNRGFFMETFRENTFSKYFGHYSFVQENYSVSSKNVLRGLHYQVDNIQGKLITVLNGSVQDVAVDLRKNSPTFGKWASIVLHGKEHKSFWIPPGFAHGFCALEHNTRVLYKVTDYYNQGAERTIRWNDPDLDIKWWVENPIMSDKDGAGVSFAKAEYL